VAFDQLRGAIAWWFDQLACERPASIVAAASSRSVCSQSTSLPRRLERASKEVDDIGRRVEDGRDNL
jgi:hypothetical protein